MKINYPVTQAQYDFLTSEAEYTLFQSGLGSGKTKALSLDLLSTISKYPGLPILVTANTYSQLINSTLTEILKTFDEFDIPYHSSIGGSKKQIIVNNTVIYLYSLENPVALKGLNVHAVYFDELAFCENIEGFYTAMSRMRLKNGSLKAKITTTPNGYGWLWEMSHDKPNWKIVRGITKENPFISETFYQSQVELFGGENTPMARQELFGETVNISANNVYYAFNRTQHVKPTEYNKNYPVYVGQDFNIGNCNSVFLQYYNDTFYVFMEKKLEGEGANTFDVASMLVQTLPSANKRIVADSTGGARKTSSTKTDLQILKDAGLNVVQFTNPLIKSRQNTVNREFVKNTIQIDPSCKHLIKELETLTHKQTEGLDSHIAVALGYALFHLNPIKPPQKSSSTINNPFLNRR